MTLSNWIIRRVKFPAIMSSRSRIATLVGPMMIIGLGRIPNLLCFTLVVDQSLTICTRALDPTGITPPRAINVVAKVFLPTKRHIFCIARVFAAAEISEAI